MQPDYSGSTKNIILILILLFFFLPLQKFLSVTSFSEGDGGRSEKSDVGSLRTSNIKFISLYSSSPYCLALFPALLHSQCYPIPTSFKFALFAVALLHA